MTYAGDVSTLQAFEAVTRGEGVLVDVRTRAEWAFVGVPVLPDGHEVRYVEWSTFPAGTVNSSFVDEVRAAGVAGGTPVYLLCRSGVRSKAAADALTEAGLGPAYNILDGFEGPHDSDGHRSVTGWRNQGLPWKQG